jgi:hypothetical protein
MIKLTMLVVAAAALYSCGSPSKQEPVSAYQDKSGPPEGVPPEAEDPDPTIRVVAFGAPCFTASKGSTLAEASFKGLLDDIALVHKLTTDKDDEALTTLQSQGVFVPVTAGVHIKVEVSESIFPYVHGTVTNKRYIGTMCVMDRSALVPRSDLPQADPPVSVEEEQLLTDTSIQLLRATVDGRDTTKASKFYEEQIKAPFYKRHHLDKGWDQVKK